MTGNAQQFDINNKPSDLLKLALLQALFTGIFAIVLYYCFDARHAVSGILGGLIASIMTLFMAARLYAAIRISKLREVHAGESLARFYLSVVLKSIFTLMMMVICLFVIGVALLPFIIAYLISAVIVNWMCLLWLQSDA